MKYTQTLLAALCVSALGLGSAFSAELRTWTDVQGRQVTASFVNLEGEDIVLQTADGQMHRFAITRLSADDQAFAKAQKPAATADAGAGVSDAALAGFTYAKSQAGAAAAGIDRLVAAGIIKHANPARAKESPPLPPIKGFNPVMDDEHFVRRVYLDIIGRIPSYDETLAFVKNGAADKRSKLIDMLLDSEGYNSHMFNYFAEMLRVKHRLDQANVRADDYVNWWKQQISENKPYDQIVKAMLTADGKMWHNGAAGYLLRDAGMPLDNLANTLTCFLGTDVACAQCHDHPFADWTQHQFYELAAFFGATNTTYRRGGGRNSPLMDQVYAMVEKGGGDLRRERNALGNFVGANRYNISDMEENTLKLPHDYKYKDAKPGDPVAPKFVMWSPQDKGNPAYKQNKKNEENLRESFANWVTHPQNPRFAMTIANRLWKRAFGVGVAEPVTNIDDPEKASNPELLKHLAEVMKSVKFDLKEFQRIVYNTHAYQSEATTEFIPMGAPYYFQGPQLRRMSAEQTWDSYMTLVLGHPEEYKAPLTDLYGKSIDLDLDNPKLDAQTVVMKYAAFRKMEGKINALMGGGLSDAGGDMMMMGGSDAKPTEAAADAGTDGANGKKVLTYQGSRLLRASELPQPERGGHFLAEFGQSPRSLIDGGSKVGSVPQVLMMMNGGAQAMLTDRQSLIFRAIDAAKDPAAKVDAVFLSIMNRLPTLQEKDIAKREIQAHGDEGYANMIWALINTREFIFIQ